jgi:hypothetical protein
MAKYKPKEFSSFIPRKPEEWFLWGAYYTLRLFETAVDGTRRFECGNPACGNETAFNARTGWLPPRCLFCGEEFDWSGIFTEKAKICPQCYTIYPKHANYCVFHQNTEKIRLQEFEYRKLQ